MKVATRLMTLLSPALTPTPSPASGGGELRAAYAGYQAGGGGGEGTVHGLLRCLNRQGRLIGQERLC